MSKTSRSLVAATAVTAALSILTLATASTTAASAATTSASMQAAPSIGLPHVNDTWGGYLSEAPKGKTLNDVGAQWTVPTATLKGRVGPKPYEATMWVGLDGYNTALGPEQAGLWMDTDTPGGKPEYWTFWEMAPANPVAFTTDGMPLAADHHNLLKVKPGTHIAATVQYVDQPGFKWNHQFEFDVYVPGPQGYDLVYSAFGNPATVNPGKPVPLRHQAEVITEIQSRNHHPMGALDLGRVGFDYAQYTVAGTPGKEPLLAVNQHAIFAQYSYPGTRQGYRIFPGAAVASSPPAIEKGHALKDHFTTRITTWGS